MSHMPIGQASPAVRPAGFAVSNSYGVDTANRYFATYAKDVNMETTGTYLLFTTETNRGRFFPTYVQVICQSSFAVSAPVNNPVINIGYVLTSAPNYDEWVSQEGLSTVYGDIGTGQWEQGVVEDITGIAIRAQQDAKSAAPGTNIYLVVQQASSSSVIADIRTVVVAGFYTGA